MIGELSPSWSISGKGLYLYPDWHTALVGEWVEGRMVKGVEGKDTGMQFVNKMPRFQVQVIGSKKFQYDPGTETRYEFYYFHQNKKGYHRISSSPRLEDPMEKKNVVVKSSLIRFNRFYL